jgi:hypothetical protein
MNRTDRATLAGLISRLETLKGEAEAVASELTALADDEQGKFDNLSEGLQASEQGQQIERAAEALAEMASAAEEGNIGEALDAASNLE